jgi:hypothetical protein
MATAPRPLPPHLHGAVFTLDELTDVFGDRARHRVRAADIERLGRALFRHRPNRPGHRDLAGDPTDGGPGSSSTVEQQSTVDRIPWDRDVAAALQRDRLDVVVTDVSAAQLHGLPLPWWAETSATLHLTTSLAHRVDRPGVLTRRRDIDPDHIVNRRGLRCTSPIRTLWDLCSPSSGLTLEDLVVIADSLMPQEWVEGFGLAEVRVGRSDLTAVLEQIGRFRGVRRAREVVALMREAVGSPQETRTRLALVDAGLPEPEVAVLLKDDRGRAGPTVDLAYRQWKIVIQYEGKHHRTKEQQERDVARDRWCELHGWRVVKVTAADLRNGLENVLPMIHARIAEMS